MIKMLYEESYLDVLPILHTENIHLIDEQDFDRG
jgi:hypothetical protein